MSSFGGTVKLTGESEYRKALSEISSNLKVLNSEMNIVTSQYDKNDKSVSSLSAQNEVLNKKIEEQKDKVAILSKALSDSKEETGENSEKTKKWQTELNNAQADLYKLVKNVEDNKKAMEQSTDATEETAKAVEDFGTEAEKSGDKAISLGDIIKANLISDLIKSGLSALADGFKAIGSAMGECLTSGAAYADNILTLSAQTGLSTDTLEKYNAVAELTDVSMETLTKSMAKNIKSMSSVQNISAEAAVDIKKLSKAQDALKIATNQVESAQIKQAQAIEKYGEDSTQARQATLALENAQTKLTAAQREVEYASEAVAPKMNAMTLAYADLGVSVYDAQGNMRDGETVYWEIIDALGKMENETERDALGMQILGKSAQELNTIIELGSDGVAEYTQKAVDMGAVLGGEGLEALGALDDQMQIFSSTTGATGNILASAFAPAVTLALEGVNGLMGSVNGLISAVISGDKGGVEAAMTMVSEQVALMVSNVSTMLPELVTIAQDLIGVLLDVIAQNLPIILTEGAKLLSSLLSGISENLDKILPVILSVVQILAETILNNLPVILEMGIKILVSLIQGISSMLPDLIPLCVNTILTLTETLLDNIDLIIDTGIDLIFALADGLLLALPDFIDKAPVIIDKLIVAITNNLPKIIEAGIELIIKLQTGIIKALPQLLSKIPDILASLINGFKNYQYKMLDVGKNLVEGIWNGIKNATSWVLDKIKGFGQDVLDGIKKIFGIHSPSTLFRDEVGKNLALGVGEGFADTMSDVSDEMQSAIPTEFDASITTKVSGATKQNSYDLMVSAFRTALREVKVELDDREVGRFVTKSVERVVYA